jgi:Arylsulfotransferase (ASST)
MISLPGLKYSYLRMQLLAVSVLMLLAGIGAVAQVNPLPGSVLNYNQVMLEHPANSKATLYKLQLADDSSFNHPVKEVRDSINATIISGLQFGKHYWWRYCNLTGSEYSQWQGPYNFSIAPDPYNINQSIRLHVLQNDSLRHAGGLIFVDEFHCVFDRDGNLVWFMPPVKTGFRKDAETFDMSITRAGTVTVITGENGIELDRDGNTLWMTPFEKNDSVLNAFGTFYNHDFKRLPDNHYMIIARQMEWKKIPEDYDIYKVPFYLDTATWRQVILADGKPAYTQASGFFIRKEATGLYLLINLGEIVEYDKKDSVIWQWRAADYLDMEDILPHGGNLLSGIREQEPRLNGFCTDSQNQYVYASFRNLDRVIKIEKSTGKVVHSWGTKKPSGEAMEGNGFFHKQHAPILDDSDRIIVFNNGDMNAEKEPSSIVVFSQPAATQASKVLWQFNCWFDSVMLKNKSSRAGSIDILPNKNLMVSMGGVARVFEVTLDKKVVWSALLEKKSEPDARWFPRPVYRTHFSSSLYPCYFTIQANADTIKSSRKDFLLVINNAGTERDSYDISVNSSSKHFNGKLVSGNVNSRNRVKIKIAPLSKPRHCELMEVSVQSHNNPDFVRKATVVIE